MLAENPEIALFAGGLARFGTDNFILLVRSVAIEDHVDVGHVEATRAEIEFSVHREDFGELQFELALVPAPILGQAIERQSEGARLCLREIRQDHGRRPLKPHGAGGKDHPPSRHHAMAGVDHERQHETKLFKTASKLADPRRRMATGLTAQRRQGSDIH